MEKAGIGLWSPRPGRALEERVAAEFAKSGDRSPSDISFTHSVRMQYYGQLNDIEIDSPHMEMEEGEHVDALIAAFEATYRRSTPARRARRSSAISSRRRSSTARSEVEKPALPDQDEGSGAPAVDSTRTVRWREGDAETSIIRLERVEAGHEIEGPAIVEHSATTFAIPPGRSARLDRHGIFHLGGG